MATLPLELIDKIFLASPNKIISTYLAFSKENDIATGNRKRCKTSISNKTDSKEDNYTIKYLLNKDTYMKYYQQSSWLKYFIPLQPLKKQTKAPKINKLNNNRIRCQAAYKSKASIEELINLIATYFNQLETYYKQQPSIGTDDDDNKDNTLLALIIRFETILDISEFSNEKYEKQLEAIQKYYAYAYAYTYEISAFVKLVLILHNCGYFESSKVISKPGIHIFLDMILEGESAKIADFTNTYRYYSAIYKFIPLFGINLGMGYSFVIGWDTEFDCMIGFTENGSDGNEVMYNMQCAMKYFNTLDRLMKIDKTQLQEDYLKMIGIKDISILLDYSRRLNICDMPYDKI
jgi:hypothetical protein